MAATSATRRPCGGASATVIDLDEQITIEDSASSTGGQAADRCQGCGTRAGEPIVIVRNRRLAPGAPMYGVAVKGDPAVLITVPLVDYGDRRLCQRCRAGATRRMRELRKAYRTVGVAP